MKLIMKLERRMKVRNQKSVRALRPLKCPKTPEGHCFLKTLKCLKYLKQNKN
jgi:hypothetical protein